MATPSPSPTDRLDSPTATHDSSASPAAVDPAVASSAAESDASVNAALVDSVLAAPLYGSRAAQLGIHAYLHNKRIKLRHQYQADALTVSTFNSALSAATTPTPTPAPATPTSLFHGCIFWLDGLTSPPAGHLLPLLYRHGGRVENKLVAVVTHCVSERLPSTKVRDWKDKARHKRWWVLGGWVTECVRRGRRVAEWDWLVPELRDAAMRTVKGMLGAREDESSQGEHVDEMVLEEEPETAPSTSSSLAEGASLTGSVADAPFSEQAVSPDASLPSSGPISPPQRPSPTSATSSQTALSPHASASLAAPIDVVSQPDHSAHFIKPRMSASRTPQSPLSVALQTYTAALPTAVPPFIPAIKQPLSFHSISTSSPTHSVPPPPPPPDYQNLFLPARPFDLNQQKSRAASRVMTGPAAAPATASVVPPATRPYLPRAVVQPAAVAQPALQRQSDSASIAPLASAASNPPSSSPNRAQVDASTLPPAYASSTSSYAANRSLAPYPHMQAAAVTPSNALSSPLTAASSSHSYAMASHQPKPRGSHTPSVPASSWPPSAAADGSTSAVSSTRTSNAPPVSSTSASTSANSAPSSSSVLLPSNMAPTAYQGGPAPRLAGRSTLNDPHFVQTFFAASRLHFIGSWKRLFQALIPALLAIPPRFTASAYPAPSAQRGYLLHCDLDCFFASVAARDHPELKGKPVAVCHATAADPSSSATGGPSTSSISSCNYIARGYGLHAEMSIGRARRMCPDLVVVPYEFEKYAAASEDIYRIFIAVTHRVQAVSLDECYMELPGSMSRAEVEEVARDVRRRVEATTGVQLSIGISHSLLLARLATKAAKPNNLFYLPDDSAVLQSYMANLSSSDVPGIGYVNSRRLEEEMKISTCAQLQQLSRDKLQQLFGKKQGITIYDSCRGIDHRPLVPVRAASEDKSAAVQRSIAVNINYGIRFERDDQVLVFLHDLSDELLSRLLFTPLCSQLLSMKLMIRRPDAPLEPPHKFLGHGVCDTRSKSKAIDGRPLGEPVGERGSDEERRERERLRGMVAELWLRLKEEWKLVVTDLRGIGLQLTKMKRRDGRADQLEAFRAYGFTPKPSPAKGDGMEERARRGDGMMVEVNGEPEDEEEWKEDGMEVDDDEEWSEERPPSHDATNASNADNAIKQAADSATVGTASAASPALPSSSVQVVSVPSPATASVASLASTSSLESLLRSALSMTVVPALQHSSASVSSPTVALPLDQLLRLLASVSQHSGLSALSLSETLVTLAGKATTLFSPSNPVHDSVLVPASAAPSSFAFPTPATNPSAVTAAHPGHASAQAAGPAAALPTPSVQSAPSLPPAPSKSSMAQVEPRPLTISEVVADVDAAKQRSYLMALPAFASLDRSVIAALPFEVRQELANAYKQKRAMDKEDEDTAEAEKGRRTAAASTKSTLSAAAATRAAASSSSPPSSAAAVVDLPRFSQVDPSVLADLPPSIRAELELEYRRRGAHIATQQRSPPISTRNAKGKKGKVKQTDKGRQASKPTAVAVPSTVVRAMNGVSIVDHFTAAEHDRRQQQRKQAERVAQTATVTAAAHDAEDVEIVERARDDTQEPQRGSRRQLNMEGAEQRKSRREEEKYADSDEDERASRRRERLREEKQQEQQRRDRHGGFNGRAPTVRDQPSTTRGSSSADAPAFIVVDPSLVPRPRPTPSTAQGDGSSNSPPLSSIVSDGADFVVNLCRLAARFVPTASLQPHLSLWLRTLRTRHPHAHPTLDCACGESVIGCFCRHCPRWRALLTFLSAQARLRNAELMAAAIAALRAASGSSRLVGGSGSVGRGGGSAVVGDEIGVGEKTCICFVCSIDLLVCELQKVVVACYDGVLKCS